jgi:6-phosphogluconate dehydrogenase
MCARLQAYDILKHVGKLTNDEMANVFEEWNKGELESFLIEITTTVREARASPEPHARWGCCCGLRSSARRTMMASRTSSTRLLSAAARHRTLAHTARRAQPTDSRQDRHEGHGPLDRAGSSRAVGEGPTAAVWLSGSPG